MTLEITPDIARDPRHEALMTIMRAGLGAVHPAAMLARFLPPPPEGRLIVLACGKAAGSCAEAVEAHYLDTLGLDPEKLAGIAVARTGYGVPTRRIEMIEAGHPIPDAAGLEATQAALTLAESAGEKDLVLCLVSGGGSSNWIAPADGLTLDDKQAVSRILLRAGVPIGALNTVRKHLSRIKGGRLAKAIAPAPFLTLAISDVPGDAPEVIASGPTVADPTTLEEARRIVEPFKALLPKAVMAALHDDANETVKPGNAAFSFGTYRLIARPADMLERAAATAERLGYAPVLLGDALEGEARRIARLHASVVRQMLQAGRKVAILSGGELTVTVTGSGDGGPNQEFATALAMELAGVEGFTALAMDSDGTDGGRGLADDPAGGIVNGASAALARAKGVDALAALDNNDSRAFLNACGGLFVPGPTGTNANDLRVICVDSAPAFTDKAG